VVAAVIVAVLGMAALAIDLIALYVAHGQAQRAADAAALAGAKMFVTSGFTSNPSAWMLSNVCQTSGPGAAAAANQQAEAIAKANNIAGQQVTVQSIKCPFSTLTNPTITVKVQQTGLPSYFAKVWGQTMNSVSATSTAEAYNPSAPTGPTAITTSIKPWLISNCVPGSAPPCAAYYFINPTDDSLNTPNVYIGQSFSFSQFTSAGGTAPGYYVITPPQEATLCPSPSANPAGSCSSVSGGGVYDNIACTQTTPEQLSCGDRVTIDTTTGTVPTESATSAGAQCLIHAGTAGLLGQGQDVIVLAASGSSIEIDAGTNNPNTTFAAAQTKNISRSDSIVTVPIFDSTINPCPGGACAPQHIIGFLQLGVQYVNPAGGIQAVIINVAGCGANGTGVSGGGVSPVPVRLIE
jgi:hypothetical protein